MKFNKKKYLTSILEEGRKMAQDQEYVKENKVSFCSPKCASCLAADARSKVDKDLGIFKGPCLLEGDPYMFLARNMLARELNWNIN